MSAQPDAVLSASLSAVLTAITPVDRALEPRTVAIRSRCPAGP